MPARREKPAAVAMLVTAALGCGMGVAAPLTPESPVVLDAVLGGVGLATAAAVWWSPRRWRLAHLACVETAIGATLLTASAATAVGAVAIAFSYVWVGLFAACFFSRGAARVHLAIALALFASALALNPFLGAAQVFALMSVTSVIASEVLGGLTAQLRRQSSIDALTGAYNRHGLAAAAASMLGTARRTGTSVAVAMVDLDGFKGINDRDGHQAGDELLAAFAADLRAELRKGDVLARLGGDEFVVMLRDADGRHLDVLAHRVRGRTATAWSYGATTSSGEEPLEQVLHRADEMLYRNKRSRVVVPAQRAEPATPAPAERR